ncbi:hypothetical protein LCGC14_0813760 [marine sediment metagenome]|uniref:Peptidase C39-like domain-containing protein n=1 Tax=marine sediment metagenome TaxID=412755 RepID=A0A0F9PQH0_9ZZZZ
MKHVMQTIMIPPLGNCFSACLASMMGLEIEDVPSFCQHPLWQDRCNEWLRPRGYWYLDLNWDPQAKSIPWTTGTLVKGLCVLSGPSPRSDYHHSVVGRIDCSEGLVELRYVHDPYPKADDAWLREIKCVGLLIPMDPGRWTA